MFLIYFALALHAGAAPAQADLKKIQSVTLCRPGFIADCFFIERGPKMKPAEFEKRVGAIFDLIRLGKKAGEPCAPSLTIKIESGGDPLIREICAQSYSTEDWAKWSTYFP